MRAMSCAWVILPRAAAREPGVGREIGVGVDVEHEGTAPFVDPQIDAAVAAELECIVGSERGLLDVALQSGCELVRRDRIGGLAAREASIRAEEQADAQRHD